jgi:predicted aspartyl protease
MRLLLYISLIFLTACSSSRTATESSSDQIYNRIEALFSDKDFFAARDLYLSQKDRLSEKQQWLCEAKIDNVFNRLSQSNERIASLFSRYGNELGPAARLQLLGLRQTNCGKLFAYGEAWAAINDILENYKTQLSADERDDYANTRKIWGALRGQPAQQVFIAESTTLPFSRDKVMLANLKVKSGNAEEDFIFDTGANLSTVTQSTARTFGMNIMPDTEIEVGAITGIKVNAQLAVCPSFRIGSIEVRNAVFIVFPDSALAFPQIGYQINGIIGFPVIEAFGDFQITRNDQLIVNKTFVTCNEQNLALDFLTPVLRVDGDIYTFDSGARGTQLYEKYFRKHRQAIIKKYRLTSLSYGGAGGTTTSPGYYVTFSPKINGAVVAVDSVQLFRNQINPDRQHFYGNIGQDLIGKFDKLHFNFRDMCLRFE